MIDPTENAAVVPTACPDCGEVTHPSETICAACGAHLHPNSNGSGRSDLESSSAAGAERRTIPMVKDCTCGDAGTCTRCVLAEYDGELGAHLMVTALDATHAALARKPADLRSVTEADFPRLIHGHSLRVEP